MASPVHAAFHVLPARRRADPDPPLSPADREGLGGLVDTERLAEWMGVEWLGGDEPLREGGPFHYRFRQADIETVGRVLRLEPPHLLEHSWFDNQPPGSIVRWSLAPDGDGCLLTLTHIFREPATPRVPPPDGRTCSARSPPASASRPPRAKWTPGPPSATNMPPPSRPRRRATGGWARRMDRPPFASSGSSQAPEAVWTALAEPEGIARWLTSAEVEPRVGGRFHLDFQGGESVVDGRITRWEPPRLLEYSWPESRRMAIRWSAGSCFPPATARLVLTHRLDAGGDLADFASGWHWHLDALDRALDGETVPFDEQRWRMLRKVYEMTLPGTPLAPPMLDLGLLP